MKTLILALAALLGAAAHAADVECMTGDRSSSIVYHADSMTMEFVTLRGTEVPAQGSGVFVAIVGEPQQKLPKGGSTATFIYKLAEGQTVEIEWAASQLEIITNVLMPALSAKLFEQNGELVTEYPSCQRR